MDKLEFIFKHIEFTELSELEYDDLVHLIPSDIENALECIYASLGIYPE